MASHYECEFDQIIYHCNVRELETYYLHKRSTFQSSANKHTLIAVTSHSNSDWIAIRKLLEYSQYAQLLRLCYKARQFDGFYMESICALELYHNFYDKKKMSQVQLIRFSTPIMAVVDNMTHLQRKSYSKFIFGRFMELYINVEMLSAVTLPVVHNKACKHAVNNGLCGECLRADVVAQVNLGYVMLFCADIILNQLQSLSVAYLTILSLSYYTEHTTYLPPNIRPKLKYKCKLLKKWDKNNILTNGKKIVSSIYRFHRNNFMIHWKNSATMKIQDPPHYEIFHVMGRVYSLIDHKHKKANHHLVLAAISADYIYEKVVSLKALSINCYLNAQYLIGKITLKCVYKLCAGYLLPSFVETKYFKQRKKFKAKLKTLKCSNCNKVDNKLKACKGCMRMMYCSVLCQKIHWKHAHRKKCDRSEHFKMLENCIIKPLR